MSIRDEAAKAAGDESKVAAKQGELANSSKNEIDVAEVKDTDSSDGASESNAEKQSGRKPNKTKWIVIAVIVVVVIAAALGSQGQTADTTTLEGTVDEAEQTYAAGQGDYTDESWETFVTELDDAQALLADENALQEDVDAAEEALSDAVSGLELKPVDMSSLNSAISTYSSYVEDDYTSETWQSFADALSNAQEVSNDENATQSEVDNASSSLISAAASLEEAFDPDDYASVSFKDLARNPDSYTGKKIVVSGKVLQVVEGSTETDLRVATDGEYDDVVFVGFDPSIIDYHILEDDNVTIYGTCIGQFSYESTLGATISLPGIYGDQVVLN